VLQTIDVFIRNAGIVAPNGDTACSSIKPV